MFYDLAVIGKLSSELSCPFNYSVWVAVNSLSQVIFIFPFVSISLAYITLPQNKRKTKLNWDEKLTTTYALK